MMLLDNLDTLFIATADGRGANSGGEIGIESGRSGGAADAGIRDYKSDTAGRPCEAILLAVAANPARKWRKREQAIKITAHDLLKAGIIEDHLCTSRSGGARIPIRTADARIIDRGARDVCSGEVSAADRDRPAGAAGIRQVQENGERLGCLLCVDLVDGLKLTEEVQKKHHQAEKHYHARKNTTEGTDRRFLQRRTRHFMQGLLRDRTRNSKFNHSGDRNATGNHQAGPG